MYVFVYELVRKPVIHKVFLANHTQKVGKKNMFLLSFFLVYTHALMTNLKATLKIRLCIKWRNYLRALLY